MTSWKPLTDLEMVEVPGGCFDMGCGEWDGECEADELPVHRVCLDSFRIGTYEVTQAEWERIMGYNPSYFRRGGEYSVENVSWDHVQEFIRRLNKKFGGQYRLPTEAEWEFAARSRGKPEKYAVPVRPKAHNELGLYDMSGNVWEWCQDWYGRDYYANSPRENPLGPASGSRRVLRGGSLGFAPRPCRSAARKADKPDDRDFTVGFRVVVGSGAWTLQ